MKALEGAFNQKALVGAFSVIVKTDGLFAALIIVLFPVPYHQPSTSAAGPSLQVVTGLVTLLGLLCTLVR